MKILRSAFWFVFFTAAVCAPQAVAMSCAPHEEMLAWLEKEYKETVISHGDLRNDGAVTGIMEITASSTGTWTIIAIGPDNNACIKAGGANYGQAPFKPGQGT